MAQCLHDLHINTCERLPMMATLAYNITAQLLNLRVWPSYCMTSSSISGWPMTCPCWDKVDLELWTVTFAGLAKPNCNVCSSPYHTEDVCPADLNGKSCCPQTVSFSFNKTSGCQHKNCGYNFVEKLLRILHFLTHSRPTKWIWHCGDCFPHPSLVNVV